MLQGNLVPVVVAAVAGMVVGALWYSPLMFCNAWMKEMGFTKKDMAKAKKKGMGKNYVLMFGGLLVMSYVLSGMVGAGTAMMGATVAFWLWLGFMAPIMMGSVLWEGKSWNLYAINVGHYLVALVVMGAIHARW